MATLESVLEAMRQRAIQARADRATEIADQVVPRYRMQEPYLSCTGHVAKQWQAAYDAALIALGKG